MSFPIKTYEDLFVALANEAKNNPEMLKLNIAFKLDDEYFSGSVHPMRMSFSKDNDVLDENHPYFEFHVP